MIGLENYYAIRHDPELRAKYDDVWVIMQSSPKDRPSDFHHVPALAPSRDLFLNFLTLKKLDAWNLQVFQDSYVPRYLKELITNPYRKSQLEMLLAFAYEGRNIALVCTCHDEELCHRSIVGGVIQGMCPDLQLSVDKDYSHYWKVLEAM